MNTFNLTPWGDKTVLQNSLKVAKKFGAHNVQCPVTASEWPHCRSAAPLWLLHMGCWSRREVRSRLAAFSCPSVRRRMIGLGACVEPSLGGSVRDTTRGGRKQSAGVRGAAEAAGVLGVELVFGSALCRKATVCARYGYMGGSPGISLVRGFGRFCTLGERVCMRASRS